LRVSSDGQIIITIILLPFLLLLFLLSHDKFRMLADDNADDGDPSSFPGSSFLLYFPLSRPPCPGAIRVLTSDCACSAFNALTFFLARGLRFMVFTVCPFCP
jgi:hypothetical protein